MMRVMMLATDLEKGGLPLRLVRLAMRLREYDIEPIVGCLARRGPLNDDLDAAGITSFSCDAGGSFDAKVFATLTRQIRRFNPDLLHASLFHANVAARLVGRVDRSRPVLTASVTIEIERRWHRLGEALTCGLSDLHVANSNAVADHLVVDLGFDRGRVRVIPNGIDLETIDNVQPLDCAAAGIDESKPLILWVGRMDPVKRLDLLVRAIEVTCRRHSVQAALIGDGPQRARIESMIASRCLGDVIKLPGWSENVFAWMQRADALMLPSMTEGSPNVLIEAMACGCPVIASDIAASRELIGPLEAGWLVPAGDEGGFAAAADAILADPGEKKARADRARAWVEKHHRMQDVVRLWAATYQCLL